MNLSTPFINRPVATSLLCLGIVLAGLLAWWRLPVAPMPAVDMPTIRVSAQLPGASPTTMAAAVATPLERTLGRIAGLTEMSSSSTAGATNIRLTFDLSSDVNGAARDVQAAINAARAALPPDLPGSPSYRILTSSDAPVMVLALTSQSATPAQMYAAASTAFSQILSQVDGVGQVELVGSSMPALRIELDPDAMRQRGIGFEQLRRAVASSVSGQPVGALDIGDRHWQLATDDRLDTIHQLQSMIVAHRDGSVVRLDDLARIVDSVRDPANAGLANGRPAVLALIRGKSGANTVAVVDGIAHRLPALRASLPGDMEVSAIVDRATTVRASLRAAEHTLAGAIVLVVLVMLVFLRGLRMALIASVAVPVSLIGTLIVMSMLGYSLDLLSLMALTIAVGFAVDDAVVVTENIARHVEDGVPPRLAARRGAGEVGLTVLTMSAVLVAVFIPLLLMGGYVGLYVREFAVTLAVVIGFSLLVSLSIVPALCAVWLQPARPESERGRLYRWSDRGFAALQRGYDLSLRWSLRHAFLTLMILLGVVCLNIGLYVAVPKGFFPRQDTGELAGDLGVGGSASFSIAKERLAVFADTVRADPAVADVAAYLDHDSGSLFASLKPLSERSASADQVAARLNDRLANVAGATFSVNAVQNVRIGGRRSRSSDEYTLQADSPDLLRAWMPRIVRALDALPELRNVHADDEGSGLSTSLRVARDTAAQFGVSFARIDGVLHDAFAWRHAATVMMPPNLYPVPVVMGVAPHYAQSSQAFDRIEVPGAGGRGVPLSAFTRIQEQEAPLEINHFGQSAAATLSFNRAPGVSLSQATGAIERAMDKLAMPTSIHRSFQGSAGAFKQAVQSQPALILGALLTLYIVLGMLYESWVHPLTILSTLPSAGVGAVLALIVFRTDFDVIALIGIFALIGIVMKNAIMLVDFARAARRKTGLSAHRAIRQAGMQRFRPILMTSLAVMLAAIPLSIMHGDGTEMHRPLGIAMGGGLIMSQLLTLYTTPVVYLYLDRLGRWTEKWLRNHRPRRNAGLPDNRARSTR
ncbi:efflux RND transporter permease subunit [Burkholderia sp. 22PA0106]|uniref:efflux RND transporter permease subunit n=1 Tax=Burkholderia sp. 22PA0106 TaxID=3237371 RepID=UPI0039C134B6